MQIARGATRLQVAQPHGRYGWRVCLAAALAGWVGLSLPWAKAAESAPAAGARLEAAAARTITISPEDGLQGALDRLEPGDHLLLRAGTYRGIFTLSRGGTPDLPVRIAPAGDGDVVLEPEADALKPVPADYKGGCANLERTLRLHGTDEAPLTDVIVEGLLIKGGIYVGSNGNAYPAAWKTFCDEVKKGEAGVGWIEMEQRMKQTFVAQGVPLAEWPERLGIFAQRITLKGNELSGRGIAFWHVSDSRIAGNTIRDSEPIIPGIVLQQPSSRNVIADNDISGMNSPVAHWHGEGIRLVNFCVANVIERNRVHDIRGAGFGITADLFADGNTYRANVVENIESIAYTDQWANSGNLWVENVARNCAIGFDFASWWWERPLDQSRSEEIRVERNTAENAAFCDAIVGCVKSMHFKGNSFTRVNMSPLFIEQFRKGGSTWDGTERLPDWISTEKASRFVKLF